VAGTGVETGVVVVGVGTVVVVGEVVVGVVVVGVVTGTGHPAARSGTAVWSAGVVATVAPPVPTPTTVAPDSPVLPVAASTATPPTGTIESTTSPLTVNWTDEMALPTQTATQPTGPPSAEPNEPDPRTSRVSGDGAAVVGSTTDPVPTA
jgi:hypothetical protein